MRKGRARTISSDACSKKSRAIANKPEAASPLLLTLRACQHTFFSGCIERSNLRPGANQEARDERKAKDERKGAKPVKNHGLFPSPCIFLRALRASAVEKTGPSAETRRAQRSTPEDDSR